MRFARSVSAFVGATAAILAVACGGSGGAPGSAFTGGSDAGGDPTLSPVPDGSTFGVGADRSTPVVNFDTACATSVAEAVPRPAYLVYMFDRSGSMANGSKWPTVVSAMKTFFEDGRTHGLQASLSFFPSVDGDMCTADYGAPKVTMRALPNNAEFHSALDGTAPDGKTPTLPALKGAISYAEQVHAEHGQDGKVLVVFVTDGNPDGCDGNTVPAAGAEAFRVSARIPTYVVGIGSSLSSLDYIAKRGGTQKAILVDDTNPSQTAEQFVKAMDRITRAAVACELGVPSPPDGQTIDYRNVNVVLTPGGATTANALPYDSKCAAGEGWRYDDADHPSKVILCPTTCDRVAEDRRLRLDVLFGCATLGDVR